MKKIIRKNVNLRKNYIVPVLDSNASINHRNQLSPMKSIDFCILFKILKILLPDSNLTKSILKIIQKCIDCVVITFILQKKIRILRFRMNLFNRKLRKSIQEFRSWFLVA